MKERLIVLFKIYFSYVILFVLQKPLFMLYHQSLNKGFNISEAFDVMVHGLPLDFSMAGYLTVIPVLLLLSSVWVKGKGLQFVFNCYNGITISLITLVFLVDLGLYTYWGFRLDSTLFFYLKSPKEALASAPIPMMILAVIAFIILTTGITLFYNRFITGSVSKFRYCKRRVAGTFLFLFALAILFIPIRGGFTTSTMNIGKAYFSDKMFLNHAAINPMFSLMSSLSREKSFATQYRYFDNNQAEALFSKMVSTQVPDSTAGYMNKEKPNVLIIVLESFSANAIESLGGEKGVTPHLDRIAEEGLFFTNLYANSFRTDRGLVSILSGYPAQPTTSIMKYPVKSQSLPSISRSLKNIGYDNEFLYGGDADFTNMRSYFISSGFDRIICDSDFPVKDRLSKWGVNDEKMFDKLLSQLKNQPKQPFMKMFLTLSSHEPFDVPFKKFKNPYLNSVAYTDSCLGDFIDKFKKLPMWNNTIIVMVADHATYYPEDIQISDPRRYHIPMIWTGGALAKSERVETFASQIDIAATLLSEMGLKHNEFGFSKNIFNPANPSFGFFSFKNGFGVVEKDSYVVYDCESEKVVRKSGDLATQLENSGKAYLQKLYDDLDKR